MSDDYIFTSESVTTGHPDKLCDQVSDAIVDHFLRQDPYSSIYAECAVSSGVMFIAARYASKARLDIPEIARDVIRGVAYSRKVFDADSCTIMTSFMDRTVTDYRPLDLDDMSEDEIDGITAKQQLTVFGYACDQTPVMMPLPIWLAHRLADVLDSPELEKKLPYLSPDGMTQVGIQFREGKPKGFFYLDHRTVDGKHNIITDTHVTAGNVHDSIPCLGVWITSGSDMILRWQRWDWTQVTAVICKGVEERGIRGVLAYSRPVRRKGCLPKNAFVYNDHFGCCLLGLFSAREQCLLAAVCQNMKKIPKIDPLSLLTLGEKCCIINSNVFK